MLNKVSAANMLTTERLGAKPTNIGERVSRFGADSPFAEKLRQSIRKEDNRSDSSFKSSSKNERPTTPPLSKSSASAKENLRADQKENSTRQNDSKEQASRDSMERPVLKAKSAQPLKTNVVKPQAESQPVMGTQQPKPEVGDGADVGKVQRSFFSDRLEDTKVVDDETVASDEETQQAMEDFISRMQMEFGVQPEQILQAFAKLDPETLLGSADDAAEQFVDNLELPAGSRDKAIGLYQQMISETGEALLAKQMQVSEPKVGIQVMSRQEKQLTELNQSLNKLNDLFFTKGEILDSGVMAKGESPFQAVRAPGEEPKNTGKGEKKESDNALAGFFKQAAAAAAGGTASQTSVAGKSQTDMKAAMASAQEMSLPELEVGGESGSEIRDEIDQLLNELAASADDVEGTLGEATAQAQNDSQAANQFSSQQDGFLNQEMNAKQASGEGKTEKFSLKSENNSRTDVSDLSSTPLQAGAFQNTTKSAAPTAAALASNSMMAQGPTASEAQANIQEIIRNAQVIMKDGGGEMKVEMTPEGMGHVNLKVEVQNGQVNIEMITENSQAKKMLESGLSDLKADLAAHKLHVDNFKIDLADGIRKEFDTNQQQSEQQRDQAREMARNFLGQFREDRESFRQGFMDNPGWRAYNRPSRREGMQPTPSIQEIKSTARRDNSRRLDLVA